MPGKDRTRRPGSDQLDLTGLLDPATPATDEAAAQRRLRRAATALEARLGDRDAATWADSPYRWIRDLATARKAKAAERLVAGHLAEAGIVVAPAAGPGHSFAVGSTRIKVRLSMRWAAGDFVFQQVHAGDPDQVCLTGIEPDRVRLWLVPRPLVLANTDPARGWLAFPADTPPGWLAGCGGDLTAATARFAALR